MLTKEVRLQIEEIVRNKPCSVQEIAQTIDKNWRTADRYVQQIQEEHGTIATRIFREGSRGALKIVFWNALSDKKGTAYQDRLKTLIETGKTKFDFSPMHIYQFADSQKRQAQITKEFISSEFRKLVESAQQQVCFFSGNLSWLKDEKDMINLIESLIKRSVKVKFLTRIDITSQTMAANILKLNLRYGDDMVAIKHCEQPLRAFIVDDKIISLKEVYSPSHQKEIKETTFIYYRIKDIVWVSWLQKVFWHLWEQSIDAQSRIDALLTIENIDSHITTHISKQKTPKKIS
ncbi:MAG TPA: hypothetical protein VK158_04740 [Acidobacteriota bacterium]|nr:hypothetical protein [Acidobacteriota bacterium]